MSEPLAYFLTWTTYGTWLPGDSRGWTKRHGGSQSADPLREHNAKGRMGEIECRLDEVQRSLVELTIARHCEQRRWILHATNCRSNHVHVVVTAPNVHPDQVVSQLKAWCTRRLRSRQRQCGGTDKGREQWWSERASTRFLNDDTSLEAAILYVRDAQDMPR